MTDVPVACTLGAEQMRAAREELIPGLLKRSDDRLQVPGGFKYRFAPTSDTLSAITQTIDRERQCCRFLRFELIVEADGGPIWLTVSGPDGTQSFLRDILEE